MQSYLLETADRLNQYYQRIKILQPGFEKKDN